MCINKGFLVLLMHRKLTFNMIVPGPVKLFCHTLTIFNCHNTINWWCNRPIKKKKKKKKKKDARAGFRTLFFWVIVRYSIHPTRERLVLQPGTIASYIYHYYTSIDKLRHHIFVSHRVVKQN